MTKISVLSNWKNELMLTEMELLMAIRGKIRSSMFSLSIF